MGAAAPDGIYPKEMRPQAGHAQGIFFRNVVMH